MNKVDATILIVDDEEDILFTLKMVIKKSVNHIFTERNPYHIPRLIRQYNPDLILLDMNFRKGDTSGIDGLSWLDKIKEISPKTEVIIITAHGDVGIAVEALKMGAADFIEKPWHNEKLLATVHAALKVSVSQRQISKLEKTKLGLKAALNAGTGQIIGNSLAIREVIKTINKVAPTDANVLILGENGTGKEMVARALHQRSVRSNEVFINVDLGSIPESLFESELFGHKKGAFTDAHHDRVGRFEAAHGGSLFLDEIGNLSLTTQSKLLYAIQNRSVIPVGTNTPIPVDIRLICATNRLLYDMVKVDTFRQDLLYRLNTVEIHVPPLRERFGDIPELANYFLAIFRKKYQKPDLEITTEGIRALEMHNWPGNIRELRQVIERATILSDRKDLDAVDFALQKPTVLMEEKDEHPLNLEQMERKLVLRAMQLHKGNITKASDELGITRAALYRRLEKFGL